MWNLLAMRIQQLNIPMRTIFTFSAIALMFATTACSGSRISTQPRYKHTKAKRIYYSEDLQPTHRPESTVKRYPFLATP